MKIKTKHIITCIKCLFLGLVMALPFIAVLPTALYYGFNEHAVSGDKVEYIPTNKVNSFNDLIIGNEYLNDPSIGTPLMGVLAEYVYSTENSVDIGINGKVVEVANLEYYGTSYDDSPNDQLWINVEEDFYTLQYLQKIKDIYNNRYWVNYYLVEDAKIVFTYDEQIKEILEVLIENNIEIYYNDTFEEVPQEYRTIRSIETNISNQNALEIAFNNVFTTKGFNWVSNSIIATPIYAFVSAFGLTNDLFISNLVVYWTNILLIYAILNIVLVVFTKLTTLGKKKEED